MTYLLGFYSVAILTSMAAMELGAWSLVGFVVYRWVRGDKYIRLGPDIWILGLLLTALVSLWLSPVPQATFQLADKLRWILVLYAVAWAWSQQTREQTFRLLRLMIVVGAVSAIYAFVEFYWGLEFFRSRRILNQMGPLFRASGFYNLSLTFAYVIGMLGFLCAGRFWAMPFNEWRLKDNRIWLTGVLSGLAGCVFSLTRGSWVAILITSALILLLVKPKRILPVLGSFIFLFLAGMAINGSFRERVLSIGDLGERTNQHRMIIWQGHWEVFKSHPFFGVGFGVNGFVSPDYFDRSRGFTTQQVEEFYKSVTVVRPEFYTHAHNNFLHLLAGTGIVGFLCYFMFISYFLLLAWRTYKGAQDKKDTFCANLALGLFGAQLFFHVGGLTEANFFDGEVNHMLVYLWGLLVATHQRVVEAV